MYQFRREAKNTPVFALLVLLLHVGFWLLLTAHQARRNGETKDAADRGEMTLWIIPPAQNSERQTRPVQRPESIPGSTGRSERMPGKPKSENRAPAMPDMPAGVTPNEVPDSWNGQPASPQLDIDSLKRAARGIAKDTARPVLPGTTEALAPAEKFGREIEKGARKDCENAYSHLGLLAIPFLVKDAVTDKGCRW